jgi:hypothetical protein
MSRYAAPRPIRAGDRTDTFDCGQQDLNIWLQRFALTSHATGAGRVFVATSTDPSEPDRVAGFYALSAASVQRSSSPSRAAHGMPLAIPVLLLGRLAVDIGEQGKSLGSHLLKDAIVRTVGVSDEIGVRALLVHAADERAAAFYRRFDFEPSPTDELHLMLLLKDARAILRNVD